MHPAVDRLGPPRARRMHACARKPCRSDRALGITIASVLLAGCVAVGPDYQAPDAAALGVPQTWAGTSNTASTRDIATWWRQFGDATLDALVAQALADNRDVEVSVARLREARSRLALASANRFPTLGASASGARSRASEHLGSGDSRSLFDASFDARWEPDLFGAQRRAVEAAAADLSATAFDLHAAQASLAAEVARNYVDFRSFQARLVIARSSLATQAETLQLTEWRTQAGLTTSLDVEQARAAFEQTRAQIPTLEEGATEARHRLAVLTGAAPGAVDAMLEVAAPIPVVTSAIAVGIPADTLRQRPDLRAAERRLHAENARIGQQAAAAYPSLALTGSIGLESLTIAGLTHGGALHAQLLGQLAATIFDAGRVRRQVDIQTAVHERALHTYESAVLTALEDVENALSAFDNAERRRIALDRAVVAARNAALLAGERYAAGITDFQTVLDTQRTVLVAEESLATTEGDRANAVVRLYKALGGGWESEGSRAAFGRGG